MHFEELNDITRQYMLTEFEAEESGGKPYRGKRLSALGYREFPGILHQAIRSGTEQSLIRSLLNPSYWNPTESYIRKGVQHERQINLQQVAESLGLTEFNTWYVRGLAKRLMEEGVAQCQAYRAADPKWEPNECSAHEGRNFSVEEIYDGHRASYWPEPGKLGVISIPFGPGCHHTIRRVY